MNERSRKLILPVLLAALCYAVPAQTIIDVPRDAAPAKEKQKPPPVMSTGDGRPVSVKLARGGKVAVDNRSTGPIVVVGWDKDFVEAVATSERGTEAVRYTVSGADAEQRVWLKADYSTRDNLAQPVEQQNTVQVEPKPKPLPTPAEPGSSEKTAPPQLIGPKEIKIPAPFIFGGVEDPPTRDGQTLELRLEVRVPRYAEIEVIRVIRSPVEITGVDSPLLIVGSKSEIRLRDVGAAEVRNKEGKVEVENSSGLVDVVTTTGPIRVRRAGGDVRILSISGDVDLECVRGRVNVDTTSGPVRLAEVYGDVDASASNSNITFSGALRQDGRYRLKSMSGVVEMALRERPAGFTAELSSYRGTIENQFQLKIKPSSQQEGEVNRRLIGSYGSGQAQLSLDTFDGKVRLVKGAPATAECK